MLSVFVNATHLTMLIMTVEQHGMVSTTLFFVPTIKKDIGRSEEYSSEWAMNEGVKDVKRDGPTQTAIHQTLVGA